MGIWLALGAAVAWGLDYALGEELFKNKISPISLIAVQMVVGAIVFSILTFCTQSKSDFSLLASHRYILWIFIATIATFHIGNLLIFYSIKVTLNATLAAILEISYPIFTVGFSWFIFRQGHLTPSLVLGAILIFAGISIIYLCYPAGNA